MPYQARQFTFYSSAVGRGNVLADRVNQFLALNPSVSPVALTTSWREGRNRAAQATATLLYRLGGPSTRWWAFEMQGGAGTEPEAQLAYFLANNPTFVPAIVTQIGSQAQSNKWRRLLVITGDTSFIQLGATNRALPATPTIAALGAAYGTFWDKVDATRPPVAAVNIGNGTWPLGGVNFLVPSLSNNPDRHLLAGIAPLCQASAFVAPAAPTIDNLCDECFPTSGFGGDDDGPQATTTTSTTTTSSTTSTTTSTSTTTTTTSTTTTTTTSTTTTTTTSAVSCPDPGALTPGFNGGNILGPGSAASAPKGIVTAPATPTCCYKVVMEGSLNYSYVNGGLFRVGVSPSGISMKDACGGTPISDLTVASVTAPVGPGSGITPIIGTFYVCGPAAFTGFSNGFIIALYNNDGSPFSGANYTANWVITLENPNGCP